MADKQQVAQIKLQHDHHPADFDLRLMQDIYDQTAGKPGPAHRHDYYSVIWPTKSVQGRHVIDFASYQIKANGLFFIHPGQVHQLITKARPEGFVILFSEDFLSRAQIRKAFIEGLKVFSFNLQNEPLFVSTEKAEKLKIFINNMQQAPAAVSQYRTDILGSYLKLFLIECTSVCDAEIQEKAHVKSKIILSDFKNLVEKHYKQHHQVKFYADQLILTSGHLNDVIKRETGVTAKEFVQRRIVLEAKRMLHFAEHRAKEIAYNLGFSDPNYFSKFFKKTTGQSISQFLQSAQTNA